MRFPCMSRAAVLTRQGKKSHHFLIPTKAAESGLMSSPSRARTPTFVEVTNGLEFRAIASADRARTMAGIHDVRQRNSTAAAIAEARQALGERLSTSDAVRAQHGKDLTWDPGAPPDAVAFVESTGEVQGLVRLALKHGVPLIPYGTGTSLEGHFTAPFGGICIDLSAMNQVLEVNAEDLDARVQAGVTRKQLNEHLKASGLFFPIDPGADASLGGMAATRASGTNAVRYGTMRDNVLSLTAVMGNGEVIRTARRARKSSAGYDSHGCSSARRAPSGSSPRSRSGFRAFPNRSCPASVPFPISHRPATPHSDISPAFP